jgi:hypothetical protein
MLWKSHPFCFCGWEKWGSFSVEVKGQNAGEEKETMALF